MVSWWYVVMRLVVLVEDTVVLGCDPVRGGVHNDLSIEVESKSLTATLHLLGRLFLHGYHITVVYMYIDVHTEIMAGSGLATLPLVLHTL